MRVHIWTLKVHIWTFWSFWDSRYIPFGKGIYGPDRSPALGPNAALSRLLAASSFASAKPVSPVSEEARGRP